MERIINSLLETDLYKFSMGQAIYHQGDEGPEALELNDKQVAIVKTYAERLPYVMRTGIKEAVQ